MSSKSLPDRRRGSWTLLRLLPALLLLAGCELNDGTLRHAAQDYVPLKPGMTWVYELDDGTFSRDSVLGDSAAYNYPCMVVERDYQEQYWIRADGELRKFVNFQVNVNGTDYPLEQRYRRYYVLPLVLGNTWSETTRDSAEVHGEATILEHRIDGQVAGDTTVAVRAGAFSGCYRVLVNEEIVRNGETTSVRTEEWLAPGVGVVKRTRDTVQTPGIDLSEELAEYNIE